MKDKLFVLIFKDKSLWIHNFSFFIISLKASFVLFLVILLFLPPKDFFSFKTFISEIEQETQMYQFILSNFAGIDQKLQIFNLTHAYMLFNIFFLVLSYYQRNLYFSNVLLVLPDLLYSFLLLWELSAVKCMRGATYFSICLHLYTIYFSWLIIIIKEK